MENLTHPAILEAERIGLPEAEEPETVRVKFDLEPEGQVRCAICDEWELGVTVGGHEVCIECLKAAKETIGDLLDRLEIEQREAKKENNRMKINAYLAHVAIRMAKRARRINGIDAGSYLTGYALSILQGGFNFTEIRQMVRKARKA